MTSDEEIFWLDSWTGNANSGFFVRNSLFEFFQKCEKEGIKVVGIKKPTDWNLEVIVVRKDEEGEASERSERGRRKE